VGSLKRRIEDLEGRIGAPQSAAYNPEREAIIAELRQLEAERGPLRQIAEREAEEGDPRRLRALEELEAATRTREEREHDD
jgi:hypothetical protein